MIPTSIVLETLKSLTMSSMFHGTSTDTSITASNGATPRPRQTYARELVAWVQDVIHLTYLWAPRALTFDNYNPHLWNIPAQFRSMVIINAMQTCFLAFNGWGTGARLWAMVATIFYFLVPVDGCVK